MTKSASKFLSLEKLEEIKANSYRSVSGQFEYDAEEIERMIIIKMSQETQNEIERQLKEREEYENHLESIAA